MDIERLYLYYLDRIENNPFYPIRAEDLHKANDFVITVKGLKYFNELHRKFIIGKIPLTQQGHVELGRLMMYHAETNGNLGGLREWNEYLFRFANKVDLLQKTTLHKSGYIARNPNYDPKYL